MPSEGKHTPQCWLDFKRALSVWLSRDRLGVLGELSQRLYTSLWPRTKLLGSQGPRETRSCHSCTGSQVQPAGAVPAQAPSGTSGRPSVASLKGGSTAIGAGWADLQQEGAWGSTMSWIYGECSQGVRQNRSPSDCNHTTHGRKMSCSTASHNGRTSKESAQSFSAH